MALVSLGRYDYCYGNGLQNNRTIQFQRNGDDAGSVFATVHALTDQGWKEISKLEGNQINVAMMSTSEKMTALISKRRGANVTMVPDRKLSELSVEEQNSILESLNARGTRKLEITNGIGRDPAFEIVVHLSLYDAG
jgi:hypothetical protein